MKTVAIFGVGLIGGSFALSLKKYGFTGRILGVSAAATVGRALELGIVDESASIPEAAAEADLLYLAQPIRRILDLLPELNEHVRPSALITDAGSTKAAIVEKARECVTRCQFLGGHPLAGKESRGVDSADANLFSSRPYVLTPNSAAEASAPAVVEFVEWIKRIGARPVFLDSHLHDRTVAYTSHLPQIASTALARLLSEHPGPVDQVFGPALVDTTRLALSPFEIWDDILATNHSEVDAAIAGYIKTLQEMRKRLRDGHLASDFSDAAAFASTLRRPR